MTKDFLLSSDAARKDGWLLRSANKTTNSCAVFAPLANNMSSRSGVWSDARAKLVASKRYKSQSSNVYIRMFEFNGHKQKQIDKDADKHAHKQSDSFKYLSIFLTSNAF